MAPSDERSTVDWAALARSRGTIVVLMGVERASAVAEALIAGGRPADTPVAAVQEATLPSQRTVTATLGTAERRCAKRRCAPGRADRRRSGRCGPGT
ncbi:SAM-dependent methyltransferase [Nocardiopsis composta]